MTEAVSSAATALAAPVQTTAATPASAPFSFHELLSELNPLQYLPVIGTIYRAVTGDTIPEPVRVAGSMVVSGLTGGPIGVAVNVALLGIEKATGFDPEKIGHQLLASLGLTPGEPAPPVEAIAASAPQPPAPESEPGSAMAWSPSQLAAYGISVTPGGAMTRSGLSGSDVLNDLVLADLRPDLVRQPPGVQADTLVG
jgi:hypothetical protein